jgi:glycosyltransferase involved in cell wall biosynthesis
VQLAALVESPDHVCCRYRLRAFEAAWRDAGHPITYYQWPHRWPARLALGRRLARQDAVIVQRRLLPAWELALLRRRVGRLIFDFDDAVFLRDSYSPKGIHSARRRARFAATVRAADAVVAGNAWLADQARAAGARALVVIPTCVDPAAYPQARHVSRSAGLRLVWVGSSSTVRGLEQFRGTLNALGRGVAGIRLKLICDRFLHLDDVPVEECPWRAETEAAEIAAADVGISWVPDDDWSRGKCGLKVLQYMAAGLPVVANPVGVQAEMVRHGENGYLAATEGEWVDAVRRLADDPDLRRTMGAAGRARVKQQYSIAFGAGLWCDLLARFETGRRAVG